MIKNIKYLILIIIFLFLNFTLDLSSKVKKVLSYKRFNILFVILLLLFNKNQIENIFIYFTFLLILNNKKYYENFADDMDFSDDDFSSEPQKDINELKKEKESKQVELFNLVTNVITPLEKNLEVKRDAYEVDNIEVSKLQYQMENLKTTNDLIVDMNKLNSARKKAIVDNLNIVKNNLPSKINVISKDITTTTNNIASTEKEVENLKNLIIETGEKIENKKPILTKEKAKETVISDIVDQVNEKLEMEDNEEKKIAIQADLDAKKKVLENQETIVSDISSYIDDEKTTKKDLKLSLINAKIEIKKYKIKLELLNELKENLKTKITNANSLCDDKFKTLKNNLGKLSKEYIKNLTENDKIVASLSETVTERLQNNKQLSDEIINMEDELSNNENNKNILVEQIQDLELQIGELES